MNFPVWEEGQGEQGTVWILESADGGDYHSWNCGDKKDKYNKNNRFAPRGEGSKFQTLLCSLCS